MNLSLAKRIEEYIKALLNDDSTIELQRSELAEFFKCVPSQINYVLSTRFTPSQGYLVESRRGGGGYLRIIKLSWINTPKTKFEDIYDHLKDEINQWEAEGILMRLREEDIITSREYHILKAVMARETLNIQLPKRDQIRSRIIQATLTALCRDDV